MPKIIVDNCKGCGLCIDACPTNAIIIKNKTAMIDKNLCLNCEVCIDSGPNGVIISDRNRKRYPYPIAMPNRYLNYYPFPRRIYYPRFKRRWRGGW